MKKKKKILKEKKIKKEAKKISNSNWKSAFFGIFGFLLTIFLVQFSYKGPGESLNLSPIQAVDFFSAQIYYLIDLPRIITTLIGIILLVVPAVFFYILSKSIFNNKK